MAVEFINIFSSSPYMSLPVNSQITTQMLLSLGYHVDYYEPIGLRKIHLVKDFKKILSRISPSFKANYNQEELQIIKTKAIPPAFNLNQIQKMILKLQVKRLSGIHIIFLPSFAPVVSELKGKIIYFVVDKYDQNPNSNPQQIQYWEELILSKAHSVVTTSLALFEHYKLKHKKVVYWPNVFNKINQKQMKDTTSDTFEKIKNIVGKKIISWGNITNYKFDLNLLILAANNNPQLNFILIGEIGIGEVDFKLPKFPKNIYFFSRISQAELIEIGSKLADVLALWNYSKGSGEYSFPMKLSEYMLCGKPIILRKSPAIPNIDGIIYYEEEIQKPLEKALGLPVVSYDLNDYTYDSRLSKLNNLLKEI